MFVRTSYPKYWDQDEASERLLIGYATGALDEALSLLAESYAEINAQARRTLNDMQTMCGALLEDIAPVAVSDTCRENILRCLDEAVDEAAREDCYECGAMPASLQRHVGRSRLEELNWHHRQRGVDVAPLRGLPARVLRVSPGLTPVKPIYNTVRFTLVLDGALVKDGETMQRGSLNITTPDSREPVATCPENGVVVLSTQENFCQLARFLCMFLNR